MTLAITKSTVIMRDKTPVLIGILRNIYNKISRFTCFSSK